MIAIALLLNLLILTLFIFVVKKIFIRGKAQQSKGGEVRRFFQYGLLFGLVVVSSIGVTGLTGRWLHIGQSLNTDRGNLALESSFALIGLPLLAVIVRWTRKTIRKDPSEVHTLGWNLYLSATSIIALILNIDAQLNLYGVVFGDNQLRGKDISQFVVWGAVWFIHFRMHNKLSRSENTIGEHLIGSLIGLGFTFIGLVTTLQALLRNILGFDGDLLISDGSDKIIGGLVLVLVGAPIWVIYWIREASRAAKESIWFAYVLLIGVGGGLLASVVSLSISLYTTLVWFFGESNLESAKVHFGNTPTTFAFALIGLLVLWYHRDVLQRAQTKTRTEIRRVYEYVISGIGLAAASAGFTMILVSIIENLARSIQITRDGSINTLLAAITLLIVGAPVWIFMWRAIQHQAENSPEVEKSSLVRRIYLLVLLGSSSVVAIISLLVATYIAFFDLFKGEIGSSTFRSERFAISLLLTTLFVAQFHWNIFKQERAIEIQRELPLVVNEQIIFFVTLKLKARSSGKFLEAINEYAAQVRKEAGCERLDVLLDPKSKSTVYLYEIWSTPQAHQTHLESQGFAEWKVISDPLVTELTVKSLKSALI